MHTFNGKSTVIQHHGDLGSDLIITDKKTGEQVVVNAQDILDFVAEHVRLEKMRLLENASTKQLLGVYE